MAKKKVLGRDLEALLSKFNREELPSSEKTHIEGILKDINTSCIQKGKYQPRTTFSEESLKELADSIRAQGIIQPIIVRTIENNRYEIIAGERRFRAAQLAGLNTIPALVRELPDEAAVAMALIENIQREDLNPIEEAKGIMRLLEEFSMTHEEIANVIGKSRTNVSNLLRLLALPDELKNLIEEKKLEMGHGRALLSLEHEQQLQAAQIIMTKNLSVRQAEQLVKLWRLQEPDITDIKDPLVIDMQKQLSRVLNTKVVIQQNANGQGKIMIKYKHYEMLQKILSHLITPV
jgi:ParB family chromosome partitioning protein